MNPALRFAINQTKSVNVPVVNIDIAIKKGSGELPGVTYEDYIYEGYGPGGVAILMEILTDNKNRTVADIRHLITKYGGNLGENGSVAWMFDTKGQIILTRDNQDENTLFEAAIDAGAEDVLVDEDMSIEVLTDPAEFESVRDTMRESGFSPENDELTMRATTSAALDLKAASSMIKMLEMLEDLDDVQTVYSNADISEEILAQL